MNSNIEHSLRFGDSEILNRIGTAWFVSYAYCEHIDPAHMNWKRGITEKSLASRKSKYKGSQSHHQTWLYEVLKMEQLDTHKNSFGLCSDELKKMANKIIQRFKKYADIENFAREFGLMKVDGNFHTAFNFTKVKQRAKGSKGCYANSALATVGDAVLKLHLTKKLFLEKNDAETITNRRIEAENNKALSETAVKLGLHNFIYASTNQESDKPSSDHATLLEAVIGAIFLDRGYEETANMLGTKFEL